jgi:hypothetical protein
LATGYGVHFVGYNLSVEGPVTLVALLLIEDKA